MTKEKSNDTDELFHCPCGKIPSKLHIEQGVSSKYSFASGDCCGDWMVEFRTGYHNKDSRLMERAAKAWNEAQRKGEK